MTAERPPGRAFYRRGRVFLAGDAAHVHPPTGGQGLNTGVQDAYNLGWKLAAETDLDTYETERRVVAADVLGVSTQLLGRYRDGEEGAHRRGPEHTGLTITYRTIEDDGSPAPGDRAPDAPIVLETGSRATLFDLFRGPHPTKLSFAVSHEASENWYDLPESAANEQAWKAYDATPGRTVTIRPDGYVAAITQARNDSASA